MKLSISRERVSKVVMINSDREALILRRGYKSERSPWDWDLPGGHLDAGESYEQAAEREAYEETGFILKSLSFLEEDRNFNKTTAFYICTEWTRGKADYITRPTLSKEHTESLWVDEDALLDYKEEIGPFYYEKIIRALELYDE